MRRRSRRMEKLIYVYLLAVMLYLSACASYKPIKADNIKSVHLLFTDTIRPRKNTYILFDSTIVRWDTKNLGIKKALLTYQPKINALPQKNGEHIANFLINVKHHKYLPIKVLPLTEFGYLQTNDGKVVFYGIMFDCLIDLSNDKSYF